MLTWRTANPTDGHLLAELEMKIFPDNCYNETTLANAVQDGGGYIVERDGCAIGYSVYRKSDGLVDVLRLGVIESMRHHGLGEGLLKLCMYRGESVMLTVRQDNLPALKLYHKLGFNISGLMPAHNSWVMTIASSPYTSSQSGS